MVSESLYKFILFTCPAGAQIMIGIICVVVWWQIEDRKEQKKWKKEQEDQANKPDNEKEDQAEQESKPDNKE